MWKKIKNWFKQFFKQLLCAHEWVDEDIVIQHLQFYRKRRCVLCGKTKLKHYRTGRCPYCGWTYRLRSVGTDGADGYAYREMCVNNECPNFMGGVRGE